MDKINVPAYFQKILMGVLDKPDDIAIVYLDETMLFGDDPNKLWEAAVRVISKLITAGFVC